MWQNTKNGHVVKRTNYVILIRIFLNIQTCPFVLESDYVNIENEVGLVSQPHYFLQKMWKELFNKEKSIESRITDLYPLIFELDYTNITKKPWHKSQPFLLLKTIIYLLFRLSFLPIQLLLSQSFHQQLCELQCHVSTYHLIMQNALPFHPYRIVKLNL